jgi:hypothetical protein
VKVLELYSIESGHPVEPDDERVLLGDDGRIEVKADTLPALLCENISAKLIDSGVSAEPTDEQIFDELAWWTNGYLAMRAVDPST